MKKKAEKKKSATRSGTKKRPIRLGKKAAPGSSPGTDITKFWNSEAVRSEGGERMTKLTHTIPPFGEFVHSADSIFAAALECPAILIDPLQWLVIKPWLESKPEEIETFWRAFKDPGAQREQKRAMEGTPSLNFQRERSIISLARGVRRMLASPQPLAQGLGIMPLEEGMMLRIAEWVIDAIENDHHAFRRMEDLLTGKDIEATFTETSKSDVFKRFARVVGSTRRLPTKIELRESEKLTMGDANKILSKLGLAGLPEG